MNIAKSNNCQELTDTIHAEKNSIKNNHEDKPFLRLFKKIETARSMVR
jgi:hypothetical protein